MDGQRFDDLTRTVAGGATRRAILRRLAATIAGVGLGAVGLGQARADQLMDECAEFCLQLPAGQTRGECLRQAAQGSGPCYQCGPAATSSLYAFCRSSQTCVINNCQFNQQGRLIFNQDTCACDCRPEFIENACGYCMVPCEPGGDPCPFGSCVESADGQGVCLVGSWAGSCSPPNATCTTTSDCCRCGINNVCTPDGYCRAPI